jgi:hypothetical protein
MKVLRIVLSGKNFSKTDVDSLDEQANWGI